MHRLPEASCSWHADTKAPRKVVTVISSSVVDFIIVMNYFYGR